MSFPSFKFISCQFFFSLVSSSSIWYSDTAALKTESINRLKRTKLRVSHGRKLCQQRFGQRWNLYTNVFSFKSQASSSSAVKSWSGSQPSFKHRLRVLQWRSYSGQARIFQSTFEPYCKFCCPSCTQESKKFFMKGQCRFCFVLTLRALLDNFCSNGRSSLNLAKFRHQNSKTGSPSGNWSLREFAAACHSVTFLSAFSVSNCEKNGHRNFRLHFFSSMRFYFQEVSVLLLWTHMHVPSSTIVSSSRWWSELTHPRIATVLVSPWFCLPARAGKMCRTTRQWLPFSISLSRVFLSPPDEIVLGSGKTRNTFVLDKKFLRRWNEGPVYQHTGAKHHGRRNLEHLTLFMATTTAVGFWEGSKYFPVVAFSTRLRATSSSFCIMQEEGSLSQQKEHSCSAPILWFPEQEFFRTSRQWKLICGQIMSLLLRIQTQFSCP